MVPFNKEKQIEYWKTTAISNMELAEIVIQNGKILHGLFCCHLTIGKALKAHYVKTNNNFAPKTHNFSYLINKAELSIDDKQELFLSLLMQYQLEGRYPESIPSIPS
ncbi:MAG: HEPN domain-containing protein [Ignavibacteriales bacterium]|nr:HEPN domain-containing protein [Ignavibacteriales bacterium]